LKKKTPIGDTLMKQNCWEYNKCGKNPSSRKSHEEEECPTEKTVENDGINGGKNGGRYCWRVGGTLCSVHDGKPVPHWAEKMKDCIHCEFFRMVRKEEGEDFEL